MSNHAILHRPGLPAYIPLANAEYVTGTAKKAEPSPASFTASLLALAATQKPVDLSGSRTGDGTITLSPTLTSAVFRVPAYYCVAELGRDDPPAEITWTFAGAHSAQGGYESAGGDVAMVEDAHSVNVQSKVLDPGVKSAFIIIPTLAVESGRYWPAPHQFKFDGATAAAHADVVLTIASAPAAAVLRAYALTPGSRYWDSFLTSLRSPGVIRNALVNGFAESTRSPIRQ